MRVDSRIFRSVMQLGGYPSPSDCLKNWQFLQTLEFDLSDTQDLALHAYISHFYDNLNGPPDWTLVREYFEKKDDIDTATMLDEIKSDLYYIGSNFASIAKTQAEKTKTDKFVKATRDAASIATSLVGIKAKGSKTPLQGPQHAFEYLMDQGRKLFPLNQTQLIQGDDIFKPLPPTKWLCEELRLSPGGVNILGGYGFSGKTYLAQYVAICVASGEPLFGEFPVTRGKVLHLDYEQGKETTLRRYQEIARGLGLPLDSKTGDAFVDGFAPEIKTRLQKLLADATRAERADDIAKYTAELEELASWRDNLAVRNYPDVYLDSASAEVSLENLMRGYDFCILDSLKCMTPASDENDASMGGHLMKLARISERTGCVPLVIHHTKKPKDGAKQGKHDLRGSSAIFSACHTVMMINSEENGGPKTVDFAKERSSDGGNQRRPFAFRMTSSGSQRENTLATIFELAEMPDADADAENATINAIAAFIAANPRCTQMEVTKAVTGRVAKICELLKWMAETGQIECIKDGRSLRYVVTKQPTADELC